MNGRNELQNRIAKRAFDLYLERERGNLRGRSIDDWLRAEKEVLQELPLSNRIVLTLFPKFRLIKVELLFTLIALVISLGQYFENVISVRMNISTIWREGYKADTRDRVMKFHYVYENWKTTHDCYPDDKVNILVDPKLLFQPGNIKDEFIQELIGDEGKKVTPNKDDIDIALNYRNAIIESLNTAEAVKAVIQSRPWPFRSRLLYWDTLEARYNPVVEEIKNNLRSFIDSYRKITKGRPVEAWHVLTTDISNKGDYIATGIFVLMAILGLSAIYYLKKQYIKLRKILYNLE